MKQTWIISRHATGRACFEKVARLSGTTFGTAVVQKFRFHPPTQYASFAFSKSPLWIAFSKLCVFGVRIHRIRVDGRLIHTHIHTKRFRLLFNPFTSKSDQFHISPAGPPGILHPTVWRTWLFTAYSDEGWSILPILTTSLIHFSEVGRMYFLGLGVRGLNSSGYNYVWTGPNKWRAHAIRRHISSAFSAVITRHYALYTKVVLYSHNQRTDSPVADVEHCFGIWTTIHRLSNLKTFDTRNTNKKNGCKVGNCRGDAVLGYSWIRATDGQNKSVFIAIHVI